jgi:hypothetical protein
VNGTGADATQRLQSVIAAVVYPDETVLWLGRPATDRLLGLFRLRSFLAPGILLIAALLVALFGRGDLSNPVDLVSFLALDGFLLLIVVGTIAWSAIAVKLARDRIVYAVTDRRVVVVSDFLARRVLSVDLAYAVPMKTKVRRSGRGNIEFGRKPSYTDRFEMASRMLTQPRSDLKYNLFEEIDGPVELQRLVERALASRGQPPSPVAVPAG